MPTHIWHIGLVLIDAAFAFKDGFAIHWRVERWQRAHKLLLSVSNYFRS